VVMDKDAADQPYALFLISVKTGERRRLTTPPPENAQGDVGPAVSPDGGAVVFSRARALFLQELSEDLSPKGQPVRLTFGNQYTVSPAWTADGRAIVFSSGTVHSPTLYKIVLSGPKWRAAKPERLAFGDGAGQPTISRQGRLAYVRFTIDANIWRMRLNNGLPATEPPAKLIASTRLDHMPLYSPDGARIAFASNRSGSHEIWVCNSDGSGTMQLTSFGGPMTTGPVWWSPNGQILFSSWVQDHFEDFVINSDGGTPMRVTGKSVSQDGKWLYLDLHRSTGAPLWKVPARDAQPSPDGRFLYYPKDGNEFTSLWKVPVDGGEATQVLESVCCRNFTVVAQGIYFIPKPPTGDNGSVKFLSFATGKVTTIAKLSGLAAYGSSVSPDGRWLLYSQYEQKGADLMLVENFH
jgi:WD40-like Beta Propeller Repeat